QALETDNLQKRRRLLEQAIALDPDCADAYNELAEVELRSGRGQRAEALYQQAVEHAKKVLGRDDPEAFEWWLDLRTRPYLRARHGLGMFYWSVRKYDAAIEQFREILRRNRNDNQGVRYILAPLFLLKGDVEGALREYEAFERDYPDDRAD